MSAQTINEFHQIISECRELFLKKTRDYGTAWRILRLESITDQIFIKAQRIRTLEEKKVSKVGEGIPSEFIGIINYCIIALIQLSYKGKEVELKEDEVIALFDDQVKLVLELMERKNHDYGEAWREMRVSSFTDLILMKLMRVKQIEDNHGTTLVSEGVEANYQDIINYSVFALIKMRAM